MLADDDRLVRAGIASILASDPSIVVTGEADDGATAVDLVRAHRLDVVLLDIQMPGMSGIEALRAIRRQQPQLPVAMLTTFSDDELIAEAIGGGAVGFLLKSDEPSHLIAAVHALADGGGSFSPRVARWLARREQAAQRQRGGAHEAVSRLTSRQRELLREVGRGHANAAIARSLHLSEGTVKQYLSALFVELGVENRVQAAVVAYRAGLSSEGD
nr:response regulator transcription factor [Agrococcus sp. ARC_14]